MNDSQPNNQPTRHPAPNPAPNPAETLGTAALLRCAADNELTAQQQAALDAHLAAHPADAARIRFERELRGACCRVMEAQADTAAPPALRTRIVAQIAQTTQIADREAEVVVAGRIGPSFLQRFSFAAAAVLVAAVGVGLLVRGGMLAQQGSDAGANPAVLLTTFLSEEHNKCSSSNGLLSHKLKVTDPSQVPGTIQKVLGRPVSIESMTAAGFVFIGAGSCAVPDAEKSVHLMFRRPSKRGGDGVPVSLFIEADTGRLDLEEGVTYAVEEGGGGSARVIAWTHEGLVYYLVTQCSVSCDAARNGLDAPNCLAGLAR